MKKISILILLLLACQFLLANLEDAVITVSSGNVNAGEIIAISISTSEILEEWDVISFQFEMNYDPSSVTYISDPLPGEILLDNGLLIGNELEPGYLRVAFSHYLAHSGAGTLAILNFEGIVGNSTLDIHDFKFNATPIQNTTDGSITVIGGNMLPVADAGADLQINENTLVQLDGSASYDPENLPLTYYWLAPPEIILSETNIVNPTFTAPWVTEDTEFTITLIVNDGSHDSLPDELLITVLNVSSSQDIPELISQVGIESIAPNPFNPSTSINFLVPATETSLELKIYSVKGQLVKNLHLQNLTPNSRNSFIWNGTDDQGRILASGIYFCRISGRESSSSARLLLLK